MNQFSRHRTSTAQTKNIFKKTSFIRKRLQTTAITVRGGLPVLKNNDVKRNEV